MNLDTHEAPLDHVSLATALVEFSADKSIPFLRNTVSAREHLNMKECSHHKRSTATLAMR